MWSNCGVFYKKGDNILNLSVLILTYIQISCDIKGVLTFTCTKEFVDDVTSAVDDLQKTTKEIKDKSKKEAVLVINNFI